MQLLDLYPSYRRAKKLDAVLQDGKRVIVVSFGARGYEDYTTHRDDLRKGRYLARHEGAEDWTDPRTPGFWARWVLWNKPTIAESVRDTVRRFNL
jgi:hypothetical protein